MVVKHPAPKPLARKLRLGFCWQVRGIGDQFIAPPCRGHRQERALAVKNTCVKNTAIKLLRRHNARARTLAQIGTSRPWGSADLSPQRSPIWGCAWPECVEACGGAYSAAVQFRSHCGHTTHTLAGYAPSAHGPHSSDFRAVAAILHHWPKAHL